MFLDKETERSVEKHHEGALPFEISVLYLLSVNPWLVCSESSCNSLEQLDAAQDLIVNWSTVLRWAWLFWQADSDKVAVVHLVRSLQPWPRPAYAEVQQTGAWAAHCVPSRLSDAMLSARGAVRQAVRQLGCRSSVPCGASEYLAVGALLGVQGVAY